MSNARKPSAGNIYEALFANHANSEHNLNTAVIALSSKTEQITYARLRDLVDGARVLASISAGARVALVMPNSLELIVGLLAVWAQGAAAAPLNPAYTANEFKTLFEDIHVTKVLTLSGDCGVKAVVKEASANVSIVDIDLEQCGKISESQRAELQVNQENTTALYLHTSGTTGKPKAVPLSHSNLLHGARNVADTYNLNAADRGYLLQVLFHIHGIVAGFLAPLISAGSIVVPPKGILDASRAWSDFSENGCTWVTGTPSILQTLLAAPCPLSMPEIRFIRSCSSPLLSTVFDALCRRFQCPVLEAYAMTEASHQMCSNSMDRFGAGAVGPERGGTKLCIWDGGMAACPLGVEGEVCVSGENVMQGYEGVSDEVNKQAFWYGSDERGNEARWFRTGDKGILSTDEYRSLTLIGRLSEIVNRGGEKISPVEVDEAFMLATNEVKEAACFAVPDEFYGQEIEAAVMLDPASTLDEEMLQRLLEERLAKFKVPKRIHFCDGKIPKGPTGKIQRKILAQLFSNDGSTGKANDRKNGEMNGETKTDDIYHIIDTALSLAEGEAEKKQQASILELGADSMALAKIARGIERSTGAQLSMPMLFTFPSVKTIVKMATNGGNGAAASEDTLSRPAAFSLLPLGKETLSQACQQAGVRFEDLEDAFPLSGCQKFHLDAFAGDDQTSDVMWMFVRYKLAKGTDVKQMLQALQRLQQHEESLRWTMASAPEIGWITLQLRSGCEDRVHELRYATEDEAARRLNDLRSSFRHRVGARTARLYLVHVGGDLELTWIESHLYTEGQSRKLILDALTKIYQEEAMETYPSYSIFVERHPAASDAPLSLAFWEKEVAAIEYSEGSAWKLKQRSLNIDPKLAHERLEVVGVSASVRAPFNELCVQASMTLPLLAESIFALSLALWLTQQDETFAHGHVAYDRATSLRTTDPRFDGLRGSTGVYHPNYPLLDTAHTSLWTYFQHFKALTQLREQNACVNSAVSIANHSTAFTWRIHDDENENQQDGEAQKSSHHRKGKPHSPRLMTCTKDTSMAVRAFKTCLVNFNRHGPSGLTITVGFHRIWLSNQRQHGCKIELIDVCTSALRFVAERRHALARLSWRELRGATIGLG